MTNKLNRRNATTLFAAAFATTGLARADQATCLDFRSARTVEDYAALRALPSGSYPNVFVRRYSASRDDFAAAGHFVWEATSSDADDDGTVIAPSAGGTGRWKRVFFESVNVKWFGARGTDEAGFDDAVPIIQAIEVAGPRLQVFLPHGTYRIAQPVTWQNGSLGRGLRGVQRAANNEKGTRLRVDPDLVTPIVAALQVSGAPSQIKDIYIECGGKAQYGVQASSVHGPRALWENLYINGALQDGYNFNVCQSTVLRRLRARDCGGDGFHFVDCNALRGELISTYDCAGYGVHVESSLASGGVTIVNAVIEGPQTGGGIFVDGTVSPTHIENCWIELGSQTDGIRVENARWARIANNRITGQGVEVGARSIRLVDSVGCRIVGNVANAGYQLTPHIAVEGTSHFNRIHDNSFLSQFVQLPLFVEDNGDRNEVETTVHSQASSAPTSGSWQRGDVVWNLDPLSNSEAVGWICTAPGTPGIWSPIGYPKGAPITAPTGIGSGVVNVDDSDVVLLPGGQRYRLIGGYEGKRLTLVSSDPLLSVDLRHLLGSGNIHLSGGGQYLMPPGSTCTLVRVTLPAWPDGLTPLTRWREVARSL